MKFAQRRLLDRLTGIDSSARQRELAAMGAQFGRTTGQQEGRLARGVALDHDNGDGSVLQAAGIGKAANFEAAETLDDLAA